MRVDYLVVGAGLTGATIARELADAGREVLVVERRERVAGNVYDYLHSSGVRIHRYGPHYFRTSSLRVWEFVNRFSRFLPFTPVIAFWDGASCQPWPLSADYFRSLRGSPWAPHRKARRPANFEEACLAKMPPEAYERAVRGYTAKQWGVAPSQLHPALAGRIRVNRAGERGPAPGHRYQGLPEQGYTGMVAGMLSGVDVWLGYDYLAHRDDLAARRRLIYTGPIDAWFRYRRGVLRYRSQRREIQHAAGVSSTQPYVQVNYPDPATPYIRSIEWTKLPRPPGSAPIRGTVVTYEHPCEAVDEDGREYPFPDERNGRLAEAYRRDAARDRNLVACGRLGEYRYLDMDVAIGRALRIAEHLTGDGAPPRVG